VKNVEALLDLADLALARCEGAVQEQTRIELASVVRRARRKLGYLGDVLVVAFAGGTRSGKSSLLNAVLGEDVAVVGVARPTTDDALAVIPENASSKYDRLLSELGVASQVRSARLRVSILIDLPDFDSTVEAHRHIVEDVLPRVDAVVWVFDPEKYADSVVHREFLARLALYGDQFIFVLNQVDRLGDATSLVSDDLDRLLDEDGFSNPRSITTVASEFDTEVSDLVSALTGRLHLKRTALTKIATDFRVAATKGWMEISETASSGRDDLDLDVMGLASAAFVSLGVEAIDMLHNVEKG